MLEKSKLLKVDLYEHTLPCFVNMMKPKLERSDAAQLSFEWRTNATVESWNKLNSDNKRKYKHMYKKIKKSVDLFNLFIANTIQVFQSISVKFYNGKISSFPCVTKLKYHYTNLLKTK